MKKLIVGVIVASGLAFAAKSTNRLSSFEREALNTQTPRVHLGGVTVNGAPIKQSKHHKMRTGYRIEKDKTTIDAYIPVGK